MAWAAQREILLDFFDPGGDEINELYGTPATYDEGPDGVVITIRTAIPLDLIRTIQIRRTPPTASTPAPTDEPELVPA